MSFSNSQLYFKAISTFILPVTSIYCLATTLQTLSPFDTLFDQKANPSFHQYLTDPSFTLFSTILFLPLLCGFITDRISVFSALRWLGCTYILSGGFFIFAIITTNIWLSIACLMLFGFSLNLACIVAYAFVCEYMFRTENYLVNFTKTIGISFVLSVEMCAVLSFMDLKHGITLMSISTVLLVLSLFVSFLRSENGFFLGILAQQLPTSTSSSSILRKSIIFNEESSSENEDLLISQDMSLHVHISEESVKAMKLMGAKGFIITMTLGALMGILSIIRQEKQLNIILEDWTINARSIQYILFGLSGLFIACGKWQRKTLEKGIIGVVIAYGIVSAFQEMRLGGVQTVPVFIIQSLTAGSALVMCLLYIPYLVGFKIRLMGKTIGLFAWFMGLAQMLIKMYSEANLLAEVTIGCVMLLCLVFMGITMKSWSVKEGKNRQTAQINM